VVLIVNTELPEENELVMAVIKKILPYGAFCSLPEYNNLEAFLHVSEVAPRWIKNIHEFISEGQKHVVKVHHLDKEKNQVDISIKRVSILCSFYSILIINRYL
jgi:translation initiation factor 2 subunit 1